MLPRKARVSRASSAENKTRERSSYRQHPHLRTLSLPRSGVILPRSSDRRTVVVTVVMVDYITLSHGFHTRQVLAGVRSHVISRFFRDAVLSIPTAAIDKKIAQASAYNNVPPRTSISVTSAVLNGNIYIQ